MQAVRSKDTGAELLVRKLLYSLGYRFRLHRHDLPGKPDIVFPGRHKVILVHGCFWHHHACPRGKRLPKTNREYWLPKLRRNQLRDRRNIRQLQELGWQPLIVWECEAKSSKDLEAKLSGFLEH